MAAAPDLTRAQAHRLHTLAGLHTDKAAPVLTAQVTHLPGLLLPGILRGTPGIQPASGGRGSPAAAPAQGGEGRPQPWRPSQDWGRGWPGRNDGIHGESQLIPGIRDQLRVYHVVQW